MHLASPAGIISVAMSMASMAGLRPRKSPHELIRYERRHAIHMEKINVYASEWEPSPGRLPASQCVYAIGDIHGQKQHLVRLLDWIASDVVGPSEQEASIITLGDYVDRGPDGLGVLEELANRKYGSARPVHLKGNHDMYLEAFLDDPSCDFDLIDFWVSNGGSTTLRNFGIEFEDIFRHPLNELQELARARLGKCLHTFIQKLQLSVHIGDYLFVHAGVDPCEALNLHDFEKLVTIREPFLTGERWIHEFVVVHGHTVCGPDVLRHRISVDSGACNTGVLTCVQLQNEGLRFIAASAADPEASLKTIRRASNTTRTWTRLSGR